MTGGRKPGPQGGIEIARAGQVCGKDGVEGEEIHCAFCCLAAPRKLTTQMGYLSVGLML